MAGTGQRWGSARPAGGLRAPEFCPLISHAPFHEEGLGLVMKNMDTKDEHSWFKKQMRLLPSCAPLNK